jgi:EAL domain-containing protein (putative c-di-GMP-specific phosphodiesterase class I)
LVVDDDDAVLRALVRPIAKAGHEVDSAPNGALAIDKLAAGTFDVVVTDIAMPAMNGIELLRAIRGRDADVPVVVMTGTPDVATAMRAIEYGALRYLVKPVLPSALLPVLGYAIRIGRLARVKREALALLGDRERFVGDRAALEASFARALGGLWMAFQPIVSWSERRVFAYEALLRTTDPAFGTPGAFLRAAETLGRLHDLSRTIRRAVAAVMIQNRGAKLFVNLHTKDLEDAELFWSDSGLSPYASSIVLEITERAALDDVADVPSRVEKLRALGYGIALDDLGAGYSGLTSLAVLEPEVVKLDMSLVRDVDTHATKQRLVAAMVKLSQEMGMRVVMEGVETVGERDQLVAMGCDMFQGFLFARPGPPFPLVDW